MGEVYWWNHLATSDHDDRGRILPLWLPLASDPRPVHVDESAHARLLFGKSLASHPVVWAEVTVIITRTKGCHHLASKFVTMVFRGPETTPEAAKEAVVLVS